MVVVCVSIRTVNVAGEVDRPGRRSGKSLIRSVSGMVLTRRVVNSLSGQASSRPRAKKWRALWCFRAEFGGHQQRNGRFGGIAISTEIWDVGFVVSGISFKFDILLHEWHP